MQHHFIPALAFKASSDIPTGEMRIIHTGITKTDAIIVCIKRDDCHYRNVFIIKVPKKHYKHEGFPKPFMRKRPGLYIGDFTIKESKKGFLICYKEDRKKPFEMETESNSILKAEQSFSFELSLKELYGYGIILAYEPNRHDDYSNDERFLVLESPEGYFLKEMPYPVYCQPGFQKALKRPNGYCLTYYTSTGNCTPVIDKIRKQE